MNSSHNSIPNNHCHSCNDDEAMMTNDEPPLAAPPQPLPSSLFHHLVPDCRNLILSYHYYEITDLPSQQDTLTPEYLSNLKFVQRYFSCQAILDSYSTKKDLHLLTNLHCLHLNCGFNVIELRIWSCFRKLKELHIQDDGTYGDDIFQHLESLEALHIRTTAKTPSFTDNLFIHLKHLRSLDIFNIIACTNGLFENRMLTDDLFENLYNAGSRLEKLKLRSCPQITDAAFSFLRGGSLRELNISSCENVTGEGIGRLQGVESLTLCGLNEVDCHEAFKCLKGSGRSLTIATSTLSSFDDKAMSHLKGISTLELTYTHTGELTDAVFSHLEGSIKSLKILACDGTDLLTKNMLWHLSGIQTVWLCDTGIRIEAEDLPPLKKVFEDVCHCGVSSDFADKSVLKELETFFTTRGASFKVI